jgi:hypothetical protein
LSDLGGQKGALAQDGRNAVEHFTVVAQNLGPLPRHLMYVGAVESDYVLTTKFRSGLHILAAYVTEMRVYEFRPESPTGVGQVSRMTTYSELSQSRVEQPKTQRCVSKTMKMRDSELFQVLGSGADYVGFHPVRRQKS